MFIAETVDTHVQILDKMSRSGVYWGGEREEIFCIFTRLPTSLLQTQSVVWNFMPSHFWAVMPEMVQG